MSEHLALSAAVQAALDAVPCGLVRTDVYGTMERVNRTFCRWVGREPHELAGRKLQDFFTVGGRIFHQTHLAPLLQMQGSVSEVKLEILRGDGQPLPVVINGQRLDDGGRVVTEFALFVAHDRDKYERELLLARRRLEAAVAEEKSQREETKDRALLAEQMVGIVSHDLRNPLQTVQMGAVLLDRGEATPPQREVLGRIRRACDRANRLIADLLDFTQARLGRGIAVQPRPMSLHQVVGDMVEELRQAFEGRRIDHVREDEGQCVGDPDRIGQVVGNLVRNALAYGRPGAPVTVRTQVTAQGCRVSVHNEGHPIPPELVPALFRPLVRGAEEGSALRNVGLGLYIVSEIAKAHGGRVEVASDEAAGTTFTLLFPGR